MNRITISPSISHECKIIEIINNELSRRVSLIYESDGEIEVYDSHHTMSELYEHRYALFSALVKVYDGYKTPLGCNVTCWKSKFHADGSMYEGYFIVMMYIRKLDTTVEQISYHIPLSWWDKFKVMEVERMWEWDGHTSDDVIKRLGEL